MGYPRRYATIGGACGAAVGLLAAAFSWRVRAATGQWPPFGLESMSFLVAPPFGLVLSYPIAAATGLGRVGYTLWVVLTPVLNWAVAGVLVGATREIRASNRRHRAQRSNAARLRTTAPSPAGPRSRSEA